MIIKNGPSKLKSLFLKHVMCRLGYHDWMMDRDTIVKCNRVCIRCNKWQHSMYDLSYGETSWEEGKRWGYDE